MAIRPSPRRRKITPQEDHQVAVLPDLVAGILADHAPAAVHQQVLDVAIGGVGEQLDVADVAGGRPREHRAELEGGAEEQGFMELRRRIGTGDPVGVGRLGAEHLGRGRELLAHQGAHGQGEPVGRGGGMHGIGVLFRRWLRRVAGPQPQQLSRG
jgi:hypothetical protein